MRHLRILPLVAAVFFACATIASAAPKVTLVLSQSLVEQHNGKPVFTAVPSTGAKYGSTLRYSIVASNSGDKTAFGVRPIAKIPHGSIYVAGSATPGASAQYTLDGKTWSPKPMVSVKQPDGKIVKKLADPSQYVGIRWTLSRLQPKGIATFNYEVIAR
jgi:uncharacterized repeat protein (TIGR01451 family)